MSSQIFDIALFYTHDRHRMFILHTIYFLNDIVGLFSKIVHFARIKLLFVQRDVGIWNDFTREQLSRWSQIYKHALERSQIIQNIAAKNKQSMFIP